jgi:ribosome recycling factor
MIDDILLEAEEKMDKSVAVMLADFATVRTGKASSSILDGVMVEYYGAPTPLKQLAGMGTPDSRTLEIRPYDQGALQDIERGLLKANLGVTPQSDGKVLRLMFPPLTEERRKDLAKVVHKMAEDGRIAVRAIRRDANDRLKRIEKDKAAAEDEVRKAEEDVQKITDSSIKKIDGLLAGKEKELMEI